MSHRIARTCLSYAACAALATSAVLASATPATADQIGPAPTATSVQAPGSFAVTTYPVARPSNWSFGGGTVYAPATAVPGQKFPALVITPGFTGVQGNFAHYGTWLASHGYVVMVIDTITLFDNPAMRGRQSAAAMEYLMSFGPTVSRIDSTRTALIGHSMGGGGSLDAAKTHAYSAVVALNPWEQNKDMASVTEPTLIVGASNDTIASEQAYQDPMYATLGAPLKAYYNRIGADHLTVYTSDAPILARVLSFLKVNVDRDARYRPFLCAPDDAAGTLKSTVC